jgi:hypothetical protein
MLHAYSWNKNTKLTARMQRVESFKKITTNPASALIGALSL